MLANCAVVGLSDVVIWLILVVVFIVAELATVGLVSIWFAAGALAALAASALGGPLWIQILLFFVVSLVSLAATRPLARKYVNKRFQPTNADSHIGTKVVVLEKVDNRKQTGMAVVQGKEWTLRSSDDTIVLEEGSLAQVVGIEGVKLIVQPVSE